VRIFLGRRPGTGSIKLRLVVRRLRNSLLNFTPARVGRGFDLDFSGPRILGGLIRPGISLTPAELAAIVTTRVGRSELSLSTILAVVIGGPIVAACVLVIWAALYITMTAAGGVGPWMAGGLAVLATGAICWAVNHFTSRLAPR
jgi:hypothetical protein